MQPGGAVEPFTLPATHVLIIHLESFYTLYIKGIDTKTSFTNDEFQFKPASTSKTFGVDSMIIR